MKLFLREMQSMTPIRDATVDPFTGELIDGTGFLARERALLRREGWTCDPATTLWSPPESTDDDRR